MIIENQFVCHKSYKSSTQGILTVNWNWDAATAAAAAGGRRQNNRKLKKESLQQGIATGIAIAIINSALKRLHGGKFCYSAFLLCLFSPCPHPYPYLYLPFPAQSAKRWFFLSLPKWNCEFVVTMMKSIQLSVELFHWKSAEMKLSLLSSWPFEPWMKSTF